MKNKPQPPKRRTKGFVIDKIYDDSFYGNLFLGLPDILRSCPFVTDIKLERRPAATREQIVCWQQLNEFVLPADLRDLYESSDGVCISYRFHYYHNEAEGVPCGIQINSLADLQPFNNAETTFSTPNGLQCLAPHCKVFTLAPIDAQHCVVLAKFLPEMPTTLWVYFEGKSFISLTNDVTTYLRMALAHLGVPAWQMTRVRGELCEWTSEILQLLAPGVLNRTRSFFESISNSIDPKIFVFEENEGKNEDGGAEEEDIEVDDELMKFEGGSVTQLFCRRINKQ